MKLTGLIAAVHTPFHGDGSLNLAVVEQQAAHLLGNRVVTVFVGGTTGECHSLTCDERLQLARRWLEVARGTELKVVVQVGANALADARALAAQAGQLGASAIGAMSPSYFKPANLSALIACCAEIAAAAPQTPFYYYDIPSLTGVGFSMPEFLERAGERIPTLAGLKFTNGDLMSYQFCLRAGGGRFSVPYGFDEWLLAALALGAEGAVGSTYNIAAPIYHRLWRAFQAGDLARARAEQFKSAQLIRCLAARGFLGATKAVMVMLGVNVGPARLPLGNPSADEAAALRRELAALGFFEWLEP